VTEMASACKKSHIGSQQSPYVLIWETFVEPA